MEQPRRDRRRLFKYQDILCAILLLYSLAGIFLILSKVYGNYNPKVEDVRNKNGVVPETETISNRDFPTTSIPTTSIRPPTNGLINISSVCSSPNCVSEVSRILSGVDTTKNPCQDFYSYSCGYKRKTTTDEDRLWSKLLAQINDIDNFDDDFLMKYKNYFKSCVEHERNLSHESKIDEIIKFAEENNIKYRQNTFDLDVEDILAILLSIKSMYLMDLSTSIDQVSDKPILKLSLPQNFDTEGASAGLWTNRRKCLNRQLYDLEKNPLNYTEMHEIYKNCLRNYTEFHDFFDSNYGYDFKGNPKAHIDRILSFYPSTADINENISTLNYVLVSVGELKEFSSATINWTKLFTNLFGKDLDNTDPIEYYFPIYFAQLIMELKSAQELQKAKQLFSYILLNVLTYNFASPRKIKDVETYCLKSTVPWFKDIASYLYFENSALEHDENIGVVRGIFEGYRASFRETFDSSKYRGYLGKSSSDVIAKIKLVFDNEATAEELRKKYSGLEITGSFMRNNIAVGRLQMKNLLNSTNKFGNVVNSFDQYPSSFYGDYNIYIPTRFLETMKELRPLPEFVIHAKIYYYLAKALAKFFDPLATKNFLNYNQQYSYQRTFVENNLKIFQKYPQIHLDLSKPELVVQNAATRLITDNIPKKNIVSNTTQIMFVVLAQEYCENLDPLSFMLRLYESKKLPGEGSVENIVTNSKVFDEAFNCRQDGSDEKEYRQFPHFLYELL